MYLQDDACSLARVLLLSQEVVEALRPPKKDLKSAISCMKQNISPLMREVSPLLQKVASVRGAVAGAYPARENGLQSLTITPSP